MSFPRTKLSGRYAKKYGMPQSKKLAALTRKVARLSNPSEKHYKDVSNAGYVLDGTGSVTLLNTVVQGVGDSQRVGKKWKMSNLEIIGSMTNGSTAVRNDIRWAIVFDKRPTGSLPTIGDVYTGIGPQYFTNKANEDRFTILYEHQRVLAGNLTAGNLFTGIQNVNKKVSINRNVVNKEAGTGAIGDIEQGALYLLTMGDVAAGTAAASLNAAFRLNYIDIN